MKKIFCLFLAALLILASFGCSAKPESSSAGDPGKKADSGEAIRNAGEKSNLTVMGRTETGESAGQGVGTQIRNGSKEVSEPNQIRNETRDQIRNTSKEEIRNMSGEQGTGQGAVVRNQSRETQEEQEQLRNQTRDQIRNQTQDVQEIREQIREQSRILNLSREGAGPDKDKIYANQNQVRLAVHALIDMENRTGGIGRNISPIAREFNNSIQAIVRAEERIMARGGIERFFFGGDENAAGDIEGLVERNRERITQLNSLMNECDCGDDVKALIREQITVMEQEQNQLMAFAKKEKEDKGLIGWLFK